MTIPVLEEDWTSWDVCVCVCVSVLKMIMEQKVERLFGNNVSWEIVLKSGKVHFRQRTRLQKVTKTPLSVS